MSIKVMSKVFEWSEAEGTDRLVMLALADFCDDDHICYPGIGRVAKKCRISERTVQRSMMSLQKLGELHREMGAGVEVKGKGFTNRYELRFKRPGCQTDTSNEDRGDKQGSTGVTRVSPKSSVSKPSELVLSGDAEGKKQRRGTVNGSKPSQEMIEKFAVSLGLPKSDGTAMFWHFVEKEWRGVKNWEATVRKWKEFGYMPSQKNSRFNNGNGRGMTPAASDGPLRGWEEWLASKPDYARRCEGLPYRACPEFMRLEFTRERKTLARS